MLDSMTTPRYSVVIPAYNEAEYLPRLIDSIDAARARFRGGPDAIEVVVANNMSTDATAEIARRLGCRVVNVEKRAISAARNGGAGAATGEILCFVDADIRIHPETFNAIEERMATGEYAGGAAGWVLERMSPGLFVTTIVVRFLTWLGGVNAGVVFCRADIFREAGGYNESRIFAEDVEFYRAMRAAGKKRGLKTVWDTGTPAIVSTRKFDRYGDWHMLFMWMWILRNRSLRKTVESYWYSETERF